MSMNNVKRAALNIIQDAVFSMMDLDNTSETLANHIGCSFDNWSSNHIRYGLDSMARDEFRASVKQYLEHLGYSW